MSLKALRHFSHSEILSWTTETGEIAEHITARFPSSLVGLAILPSTMQTHRLCLGASKSGQAGTPWVGGAGQLSAASAGRRRSIAEYYRAHQLPVLARGSSGSGKTRQMRTNRTGSSSTGSSKTRKQVPLADPQRWQQRYTSKLGPVILALAITGASLGPWLDGIHSRVGLIIYDRLPLTIGSLHTSLTVPILLSAFYAVLGSAFAFFDYRMAAGGDATTQEALGRSSLTQLALCFGWGGVRGGLLMP